MYKFLFKITFIFLLGSLPAKSQVNKLFKVNGSKKQTNANQTSPFLGDSKLIKNKLLYFKKDSLNLPKVNATSNATPKEEEFLKDKVKYKAFDSIRSEIIDKKVHLYNKAEVDYTDINLKAGYILIDWNTSIVKATGLIDNLGKITQKPIFEEKGKVYTSDTIVYNFKTKKGIIKNSQTEQNEGIIKGKIIKKESDKVLYISDGYFTTDKKVKPDYYIYSKKIKMINQEKVVAGFTQMFIADVPTFLVAPFGFFPMTKKRTSGILIPSWGDTWEQGYFLQNGGFYWAASDYFDFTVRGDFYSRGGWAVRSQTSYINKYKFSGTISYNYENLIQSEKGQSDYSKQKTYKFSLSHRQDPKSSPYWNFNANINFASREYFRQSYSELATNNLLNNNINSSVSLTKTFEDSSFRISMNVNHSQNLNTGKVDWTLPSLTVSRDPIYPFAPANGPKSTWYEKIQINWDLSAENRLSIQDSIQFTPKMFENSKNGVRQSIRTGTNLKLFKYLNFSTSFNYTEKWYLKSIRKYWGKDPKDTEEEVEEKVVTEDVNGFARNGEFSTSLGLNTQLYGILNFGKESYIQAIRHVLSPSVSLSYRPDFGSEFWGYYDTFLKPESTDPLKIMQINMQRKYSRFEGFTYGGPGQGEQANISFSLGNSFGAKIRSKTDTVIKSKKIPIFETLNFSGSYNVLAEEYKWSDISMAGSTKLLDKINLNFRATFSPYQLDENHKRINKLLLDDNGFLRMTNAGFGFGYSFSNADFEGKKSIKNTQNKKTKSRYSKIKLLWNFGFNYSWNYSKNGKEDQISQTLSFNGGFKINQNWKLNFSSGYDFRNNDFSHTTINIERDLDSWVMRFNWSPIGRPFYRFFIGIKASILQDIKWEKDRPRSYRY